MELPRDGGIGRSMGSKHPKGGRKDRSGKPGPKSKKVNKKEEQEVCHIQY